MNHSPKNIRIVEQQLQEALRENADATKLLVGIYQSSFEEATGEEPSMQQVDRARVACFHGTTSMSGELADVGYVVGQIVIGLVVQFLWEKMKDAGLPQRVAEEPAPMEETEELMGPEQRAKAHEVARRLLAKHLDYFEDVFRKATK